VLESQLQALLDRLVSRDRIITIIAAARQQLPPGSAAVALRVARSGAGGIGGVGEGSGTGRSTIFEGSVWMGGAVVGQDSAPVPGREDRRWQWLNPVACPSARFR
jgi:hypothetical protein